MKKIEIEGCDGSGKTTALKYLIEKLQERKKNVVETREVGSPHVPINVKLRELVLDPSSDLSGESMEFIFAAMRVEHDKFLKTVADDTDFVVSDRGWLSHLAYTDHNVSKDFTNDFYYGLVQQMTSMPDVVIYFSVNTQTALQRRIKRGEGMDVIEMKGVEYQELVRESFLDHIRQMEYEDRDVRVFMVDANQDIQGVRAQLDEIIEELISL